MMVRRPIALAHDLCPHGGIRSRRHACGYGADLINALNFVLDREGLPPVPLASARNMIGAGARKLIERGLELEGRFASIEISTG